MRLESLIMSYYKLMKIHCLEIATLFFRLSLHLLFLFCFPRVDVPIGHPVKRVPHPSPSLHSYAPVSCLKLTSQGYFKRCVCINLPLVWYPATHKETNWEKENTPADAHFRDSAHRPKHCNPRMANIVFGTIYWQLYIHSILIHTGAVLAHRQIVLNRIGKKAVRILIRHLPEYM